MTPTKLSYLLNSISYLTLRSNCKMLLCYPCQPWKNICDASGKLGLNEKAAGAICKDLQWSQCQDVQGRERTTEREARLPLENLVDQGQCMSLVHSRVFSINRQRHSADWTHISKRGPASPTSSVASLNTLRGPIVHGKILPRKRLQFSNYVSPVLAVITGQQRLKDAIAVFTRTFTR